MKTLAELKQERAAKIKAQKALLEKRKAEKRAFSEEETTEFRALNTEIEALDNQIKDEEMAEAAERRSASLAGIPVATPEKDEEEKIQKRFDIKKMMNTLVDKRGFDGAEKEVNDIALEELRNSGINDVSTKGFNIPSAMAFRAAAHTATEDALAFGGTLVQEEAGKVLPAFVDKLSIEALGITPMYNVVGNYPLHSVGDFAFENVGETDSLTAQKAGTSKRVLKPKRTGLMTYISNQLLAQSSVNIHGILGTRITQALSRRFMLDLLNGDGNDPNTLGLLNDALAFDFAGAAGTLTLHKVLELIGKVDSENATEDGLRFLLHTQLSATVKEVPIDAGSGIFLMDKANQLYGSATSKTSQMPILNAGAEFPLIYGDFKSVEAAIWGGINIKTDDNTRADSNETRLIVNVHRDIMASNPKAFAVNKKITLA